MNVDMYLNSNKKIAARVTELQNSNIGKVIMKIVISKKILHLIIFVLFKFIYFLLFCQKREITFVAGPLEYTYTSQCTVHRMFCRLGEIMCKFQLNK
jgi:hypothetical protein